MLVKKDIEKLDLSEHYLYDKFKIVKSDIEAMESLNMT